MKLIDKISATDLRDFLKGNGWEVNKAALNDDLFVFSHLTHPRRQLVFPIQKTAVDFSESVEGTISKYSELSGESSDSVVQRVLGVRKDGLRLRIHSRLDDVTLPLGFASDLVNGVEKLIKSTACTVLNPRVLHPRLSHREATQMLGHTQFGQTEVGSFVVNVACPINALDAQGNLELTESDAPFVRQVFETMNKGVRKLVKSVEADTLDALVDELKEATHPIVSSNMCDALASMYDGTLQNSLDLRFLWSSLRPVRGAEQNQIVRIQDDYFSRIEEVRKELRSEEIEQLETFFGTVERLDGDMGEDGKRSGAVLLVLLLSDEDESVRASVSLNAGQYADAIKAHETNGAYIRITGRLHSGRQPRTLRDITKFELVQ
ncbi:hypothetical protein [Pseudophaeobacter leonis]|uniref:hypothetical protein n=1 Tax=Pseudophaeobacter leonis TaxID=1144477 RepID=UPI0009F2FC15|nr:hypothetical protein [Pseudophaeobacter leonis]